MENLCGQDSPPNPYRMVILSTLGEGLPTANEPAAEQCGVSWFGDWLELLNMETEKTNMACYRPHMRLPAGRYAA